jgi:hypothetical protein
MDLVEFDNRIHIQFYSLVKTTINSTQNAHDESTIIRCCKPTVVNLHAAESRNNTVAGEK